MNVGKISLKQIVLLKDLKKFKSAPSAICVWLIVVVLKEKAWYKATLSLASLLSLLSRSLVTKKFTRGFRRADWLDLFLCLMVRANKPYPIPLRVQGLEHLERKGHQNGTIICTVHLPLVIAGIGGVLKKGVKIDATIAAVPTYTGPQFYYTGSNIPTPAILSDNKVLLKSKSLLKKNGVIVVMIDYFRGELSPNMMRLASKMGSRIVFLIAELASDSTIDVKLIPAPDPYCSDENGINENLKMLRARYNETIENYSKNK